MRRLIFISVVAFLFLVRSSISAQMPDTNTFMGMLTACASGASTEFDANLVGSIKELYEGQSTKGYAKLRTQTDFLSLLPDKDKLEGYRLYTECIKSIVINPSASRAEVQTKFLDGFDFSTTLDKIKEVFGAPAKSRDGYLWFEGENLSLFVHLDKQKDVDRVAVYASSDGDKARIPMLNMGNVVGGDTREFYNLGDLKFSYVPELCQTDTLGEGHARFAFKITEPCYFGKPGGYMNYVFVFQPSFDDADCHDNFIEEKKYAKFRCKTTKDMIPVLALVYSDEENYNSVDDANNIMEWIYRF